MNKNTHKYSLLALTAGLAFFNSASAAVVFNTAGPVSYTYSGSGPAGLLPSTTDATLTNIIRAQYIGNSSGSIGLTNANGTAGTILWHFQTGPGIQFSGPTSLQIGYGARNNGSIVAEYSTDGSSYTQWGSITTTGGPVEANAGAVFNGSAPTTGATNLYLKFTLTGTSTGNTAVTWGGLNNERSFSIAGATAFIPEPSSALLGGLGALVLLRRRRA